MDAQHVGLALPELADRLEDLDGRRTPVGWTPDDAVEKATIERQILGLVTARPDATAPALPCRMEIRFRNKDQTVDAVIREVRAGGLWIQTPGQWIAGTHVEMQFQQSESDEHGLRARGIVTRFSDGYVLVAVDEQPSEAHERRLHRFVLELIRHRVQN